MTFEMPQMEAAPTGAASRAEGANLTAGLAGNGKGERSVASADFRSQLRSGNKQYRHADWLA